MAANVLLGEPRPRVVYDRHHEDRLVGPRGRGLAVGLNEFAGYLAVGTALATGYLASSTGSDRSPSTSASATLCSGS